MVKTKVIPLLQRIFFHSLFLLSIQSGFAQQILVPPYIQPGNAPNFFSEQKVVIWQTDSLRGNFRLEWGEGLSAISVKKFKSVKLSATKLNLNNASSFLYRGNIKGLKFDRTYVYRVTQDQKTIAEHVFQSRTKKPKTRFAVFGDNGAGTSEQAAIAHQIYLQKPMFALLTGDMAYSYGRELEYRHRFFPYYLAQEASPVLGAPLMGSIPFYMFLGNHDIYSADFTKYPDGLAYFYYSDLPLNAPIPKMTVTPEGPQDLIDAFVKNTAPRFPRISNYSFQYGNVHIVCLDANYYVNPLDPALMEWLANDLRSSKADWKIVAYHHPAFNSSLQHHQYQVMRLAAPIFESLGVDLVFNGHVHNYQRTIPLKFNPKINEEGTRFVVSEEGSVDGEFTLDLNFDGVNVTKPEGIIHIVTGAGGAALYDPEISENPDLWTKGTPENWAPFTVKLVSDRHSFTMVETDGKTLILRQLDGNGNVFDEIKITK
ncbi:hypothetical protein P872_07680 [Rhodonellum psychrophilum GCM71 = DSM 17998]|uniref:Calcineurin-like phosphoesterase domain-containing protein n=4 Tax=Rhodonellum TaxID=336827 RepID=U5C0U3_9BACT|nr:MULTISPECIES: metallophosphoesterase [Rhodonellum]ERM81792.1 hypothetical protein P872_07680 [Rhodonellum psychrophilum GCM71 = DSM 17998]SDZ28243.1 Calcineurin-like phosphoesterase [Rhodonellum ikkaensis]